MKQRFSAAKIAILVASWVQPMLAQVAPRPSPCALSAVTRLQSRVECFLQVRKYADSTVLMDLVLPVWIEEKGAELLRLRSIFGALPDSIGRDDRLRVLAASTRLVHGLDTTDLETDIAAYDAVFVSIDRKEPPKRFLRPLFAFLFLENSRLLKIEVVASSINRTSDSTARFYLSERATSPVPSFPLDLERKRTFSWRRVQGKWFLSPDG